MNESKELEELISQIEEDYEFLKLNIPGQMNVKSLDEYVYSIMNDETFEQCTGSSKCVRLISTLHTLSESRIKKKLSSSAKNVNSLFTVIFKSIVVCIAQTHINIGRERDSLIDSKEKIIKISDN